MKHLVLIVGAILIAANILMGLLLSCYSSFNMWFSTIVISITTALIYMVQTLKLKDAFKVSLTLLLPLTGFLKLLLGVFAPNHIEDNWCLIVCVFITLCEILTLLVVHKTSSSV